MPCGVPACGAALRNVPAAELDSIEDGAPFGCEMIGGGGSGVSAYLYPSLMDEAAAGLNFETVGETASLFLVTSDCIAWLNISGVVRCNQFDSDGNLHRSVVRVPLQFKRARP